MTTTAQPAKLKTPIFRGSYVHLLKPRKNKAKPLEAGKYQITIVLPKNKPETKAFIKELEKAFTAAMIEKFGKAIPFNVIKHYPIKDGDLPNEDGDTNEAHAGCWVITASNSYKPHTIGLDGQDLLEESEVYSGAWYRATVGVYAWKHEESKGKGVSVDLKSVIKIKDDGRFGGGSRANEDFADDLAAAGTATDDEDDLTK